MDQEQAFLQAMREQPRDLTTRLVFADWLEERGDPRGELLRLTHTLTQATDQPNRHELEDRLRSLLAAGVQPVGPFWMNSLGIRFAWVPPGVFLMGSPATETDRGEDETQHRVRLTKGLWLGVDPVTQTQWEAVHSDNPSFLQGYGVDLPVEQVSWEECQAFCAELHKRDGRRYALPTEAEWEYACRAGTTTPFYFGTGFDATRANCAGSYRRGAEEWGLHSVGPSAVGPNRPSSFRPNAWGLHDMHGNVREWCQDLYVAYHPVSGDLENPVNRHDALEERRVVRGGSWFTNPGLSRAASRASYAPGYRYQDLGFRVCFRLD
jgi:uncharacterized protein (TIGR02996 family)